VHHQDVDERLGAGFASRDALVVAGLGALVVAIAVPYLVAGPGFIVDDWRFLERGRLDGPFAAPTVNTLFARPGSWATTFALHGVIGPHPSAIFVVQTLLNVAVAAALYLVGKRFVSPTLAACVAAVWVVIPIHTTLSYWAAVANGTVALLLLIVGIGLLDARRWLLAGAALVVSALCYEATLLPAVVAVVAVPAFRHRLKPVPCVSLLGALGVTGLWMYAHATYPLDRPYGKAIKLLRAHFGQGLTGSRTTGTVLTIAAAAAVLWILIDVVRRRPLAEAGWLVLVGIAVIPIGAAAFARLHFGFVGTGDRVYTVSAVGCAMFWVGFAALVWSRARWLAVVGALAFLVAVTPAIFERQRAYHRAGVDAVALGAYLRHRFGSAPAAPLVLGPGPRRHHGVPATLGREHAAKLAQFHLENPDVELRVAESRDDFLSIPAPYRITWAQVDRYRTRVTAR
jgi:hypothetical protein